MRVLLAVVVVSAFVVGTAGSAGAESPLSPLKVVGNEFQNAAGGSVHLVGVNRSGTEYACVQGWGIFDGPSDDNSVAAIATWGANAVRIGLNEDCWLGINGVNPLYSGTAYRQAVADYVGSLHSHGLYAIVALMWAAPGGNLATWQEAMADADHAPAFWSSVASTFRDDGATIFDLYGEPSWVSWQCWVDGCTYADKFGSWRTAGMQKMLNSVRQAGAHNVVLMSGADYANDLSSWLEYEPNDPDHQTAAAFHQYGDNTCHDQGCWDSTIREVAKRVPLVTAELGERADGASCGHTFVDAFVGYARNNGISFLAWAWDTWNRCSTLIADYSGTPTAFGAAYRSDISNGQPFGTLPYTSSRPSRPLFELPEHERQVAVLAVVGLSLAVVMLFLGGRRRRGTARHAS